VIEKKGSTKPFNNVYVKNFPAAYTEEDVKKLFS
jgi:RNA recognition motif-containing protein